MSAAASLQGLKPRLRARVLATPQPYRGEASYVLHEPLAGVSLRLSQLAYRFVARLNGQLSVAHIRELVAAEAARWGAPPLADNEVAELLSQLRRYDMVEHWGDDAVAEIFAGQGEEKPRARGARNPLFLQLPLFDAAPLVETLYRRWRGVFTRGAAYLCVALIGGGLLLAALHAQALLAYAHVKLEERSFLGLMWLCYPLLKLAHELSHGLVLRHCGGRPGKFGLSLILLTPVPHLDASDSARFASRYARAAVAAAGIACELCLATLALCTWLLLPEGSLREACFAVMLIGGLGTVLVNGNPLLRYDAYFIASDLLQLPNLASRSQRWLRQWLERRLLGLAAQPPLALAPGERPWLIAYALASPSYRLLFFVSMLLALAGRWPSLALVLAVLLGAGVLRGWWQQGRDYRLAARYAAVRTRAIALWLLLPAGLLALLAGLPLPRSEETVGIVSLPEEVLLRARQSGLVVNQPVRDGQQVQPAQLLLELANPRLELARARAAEQRTRARSRELAAFQHASQMGALRAAREQAERAYARALSDETELRLLSPAAGPVRLWGESDWAGRWIAKGELLGWVEKPATVPRVIFLLSAESLAAWPGNAAALRVFAPGVDAAQRVEAVRVTPEAVSSLPSAALAQRNGGPFATAANPREWIPLATLFQVEADCRGLRLLQGQRVRVSLRLAPQAVLPRLWQALQRRWQEGESLR